MSLYVAGFVGPPAIPTRPKRYCANSSFGVLLGVFPGVFPGFMPGVSSGFSPGFRADISGPTKAHPGRMPMFCSVFRPVFSSISCLGIQLGNTSKARRLSPTT
jgi:hypothetical protein